MSGFCDSMPQIFVFMLREKSMTLEKWGNYIKVFRIPKMLMLTM